MCGLSRGRVAWRGGEARTKRQGHLRVKRVIAQDLLKNWNRTVFVFYRGEGGDGPPED